MPDDAGDLEVLCGGFDARLVVGTQPHLQVLHVPLAHAGGAVVAAAETGGRGYQGKC